MSAKEDFRVFYNQNIFPELSRLDTKRKKVLRNASFVFTLISILLFFAIIKEFTPFILLLLIPFVFFLFHLFAQLQKFKHGYKPKVIQLLLTFLNKNMEISNLKFDQKKFISKEKIIKSRLFDKQLSKVKGEDLITGQLGENQFSFSESYIYLSDFNNIDSLFFKGLFLEVELNFEGLFENYLMLPKKFLPYLNKSIRAFSSDVHSDITSDFDHPVLKDYVVYGDLELTQSDKVMQTIIENLFDTKKSESPFFVSIQSNWLYLGIKNEKDILEPKIWSSAVNFDLISEFFDDLYHLLQIIEAVDNKI